MVVLGLLLVCIDINAQEVKPARNSILFGGGLGVSTSNYCEGFGFQLIAGYQRNYWDGRLRFNPNLSFGTYSSSLMTDTRDEFFNTLNLETNLYLDVIRVKWFSVYVGGGVLANYSYGLLGTDYHRTYISSEYLSAFNLGCSVAGGFRINPTNSRFAYNIVPLNLHFGNDYFYEYHLRFELEYKF